MFCTQCGKQTTEGARFCAHCGARLGEVTNGGMGEKRNGGVEGEQSRVGMKKALCSLGGVVVVGILIFVLWRIGSQQRELRADDPRVGNIVSEGLNKALETPNSPSSTSGPVAVPNVVGLTEGDARSEFEKRGLIMLTEYRPSRQEDFAHVLAQNYEPGLLVGPKVEVTVTVGNGPSEAQARETTEQEQATACMSNVRQLLTAARIHAQDNDGRWPPRGKWCDAIFEGYVNNDAIYVCPGVPNERSGYGYNELLSNLPQSKVASASSTVGLFDAKGGWNQYGGPSMVVARHLGGANVGFPDGHAKLVRADSLSSLWRDPTRRAR
jgi:prepilin-type processing-associated H-X9-DG protein